jgi:hypothetical protein
MIQEYEYMQKVKTVSGISPYFTLKIYVKHTKAKSVTEKAQRRITNNNYFLKNLFKNASF